MKYLISTLLVLFVACGPSGPENAPGQHGAEGEEPAMDEPPESPGNQNLRLFEAGIDFYARGNEPFWALDMDLDRIFTFRTPDGLEFNSPPTAPDLAQDAPVSRYRVQTERGEMIATLSERDCVDNMSGERFSHTVRVSLQLGTEETPTTFEGCGRYVVPPRLHDIWVLQSWRGKPVVPDNMPKGSPTLEFYSGERRISGHTGCNNINGTFNLMGPQTIQFGALASTSMACPSMELEDDLQSALSERRLDFRFEERNLILSRRGEDVATFLKVD